MYKLKFKIWFEKEEKVFGKGPYELLNGIKEKGSLAEAAKSMGMSYNKAFNLIKGIEKELGFDLHTSKRGGSDGGGAILTKEAEELMDKYNAFMNECEESIKQIFERYFN